MTLYLGDAQYRRTLFSTAQYLNDPISQRLYISTALYLNGPIFRRSYISTALYLNDLLYLLAFKIHQMYKDFKYYVFSDLQDITSTTISSSYQDHIQSTGNYRQP